MRITHIERDVASVRSLVAQDLDQFLGFAIGVGKHQPSPAAIDEPVLLGFRLVQPVFRFEPMLAHALQAVVKRTFRSRRFILGHVQTSCACSHISRSATCQSSEPRKGVMYLVGSAYSFCR